MCYTGCPQISEAAGKQNSQTQDSFPLKGFNFYSPRLKHYQIVITNCRKAKTSFCHKARVKYSVLKLSYINTTLLTNQSALRSSGLANVINHYDRSYHIRLILFRTLSDFTRSSQLVVFFRSLKLAFPPNTPSVATFLSSVTLFYISYHRFGLKQCFH